MNRRVRGPCVEADSRGRTVTFTSHWEPFFTKRDFCWVKQPGHVVRNSQRRSRLEPPRSSTFPHHQHQGNGTIAEANQRTPTNTLYGATSLPIYAPSGEMCCWRHRAWRRRAADSRTQTCSHTTSSISALRCRASSRPAIETSRRRITNGHSYLGEISMFGFSRVPTGWQACAARGRPCKFSLRGTALQSVWNPEPLIATDDG
ncbi:microcystin-dependent protein [Ensifer sp. 4252]